MEVTKKQFESVLAGCSTDDERESLKQLAERMGLKFCSDKAPRKPKLERTFQLEEYHNLNITTCCLCKTQHKQLFHMKQHSEVNCLVAVSVKLDSIPLSKSKISNYKTSTCSECRNVLITKDKAELVEMLIKRSKQ